MLNLSFSPGRRPKVIQTLSEWSSSQTEPDEKLHFLRLSNFHHVYRPQRPEVSNCEQADSNIQGQVFLIMTANNAK